MNSSQVPESARDLRQRVLAWKKDPENNPLPTHEELATAISALREARATATATKAKKAPAAKHEMASAAFDLGSLFGDKPADKPAAEQPAKAAEPAPAPDLASLLTTTTRG